MWLLFSVQFSSVRSQFASICKRSMIIIWVCDGSANIRRGTSIDSSEAKSSWKIRNLTLFLSRISSHDESPYRCFRTSLSSNNDDQSSENGKKNNSTHTHNNERFTYNASTDGNGNRIESSYVWDAHACGQNGKALCACVRASIFLYCRLRWCFPSVSHCITFALLCSGLRFLLHPYRLNNFTILNNIHVSFSISLPKATKPLASFTVSPRIANYHSRCWDFSQKFSCSVLKLLA